jgi:hypothetical protein
MSGAKGELPTKCYRRGTSLNVLDVAVSGQCSKVALRPIVVLRTPDQAVRFAARAAGQALRPTCRSRP